jgi:hypothetical protein
VWWQREAAGARKAQGTAAPTKVRLDRTIVVSVAVIIIAVVFMKTTNPNWKVQHSNVITSINRARYRRETVMMKGGGMNMA